jgi:hypothetical protein
MIFDSRISGIPCQIRVTSHQPFIPARTRGRPEDCYPAEGGKIEYDVLTMNGKPAGKWLTDKITERDDEAIYEQFLETLKGDYYV